MLTFTKISAVLSAVAGFAVSIPATPVIAAPTPIIVSTVSNGLILGRVMTTGGEAITGAQVTVIISGSTETVISTRTQTDGRYKLSVPNMPGAYTMRVLHVGYTPFTMPLTRMNNGWNVPEEIAMRPIASDPSGIPASSQK